MTFQTRDVIHCDKEAWSLEAWASQDGNDESVFKLNEFGLYTKGGRGTGCYRGYRCTYHTHEGFLQLIELEINLDEATAPLLNGRRPIKNDPKAFSSCGNQTYTDVHLHVPFTGGLLLCRQPMQKLPASIGPELAWRYEHICELVLDDGRIAEAYDRSAALAQVRKEVTKNNGEIIITESVSSQNDEVHAQFLALKARINDCFTLDYYD